MATTVTIEFLLPIELLKYSDEYLAEQFEALVDTLLSIPHPDCSGEFIQADILDITVA